MPIAIQNKTPFWEIKYFSKAAGVRSFLRKKHTRTYRSDAASQTRLSATEPSVSHGREIIIVAEFTEKKKVNILFVWYKTICKIVIATPVVGQIETNNITHKIVIKKKKKKTVHA